MTSTRIDELIRDEQIASFNRDGAMLVRKVIEPEWVERMRSAIQEARTTAIASVSRGFYNGFFAWRGNEDFREFIFRSRLAELAARLLGARGVSFFYDQLMVKEPGLGAETPWHFDSAYFPTSGGKILSIWVPFDHASPENGAVTYLCGSHHKVKAKGLEWANHLIATLPEPGSPVPGWDLLAWTLEPGDVLVHDVDIIHGAPVNRTDTQRRALATRWMDQDVHYRPDARDFFHLSRSAGMTLPEVPLRAGDPMTCELFPLVWPEK